MSIEGVLRDPSLVFSQPAVVFGAVPLNVKVSLDLAINPVDYPRYYTYHYHSTDVFNAVVSCDERLWV